MAYIPNSGSVVAFQSDPTKLVGTVSVVGTLPVVLNNSSVITAVQGSVATVIIGGSIAASFTPPANQSVSGTIQADIRGSVATVIIGGSVAVATGNSSVQVLNFPVTQNVSGSVVATQGTSPWVVNTQNSSYLSVPVGSTISYIQNSVAAVIIGGSIAASFTPPANQSVSGAVSISNLPANQSVSGTVNLGAGTTTIGSVTVLQGTNPFIITGSIQGGAGTQYLENAITPSVTGNAIMFKSNISSSIVSVVTPSTPLPVYGSVSGAVSISNLPANQSVSGAVSVSNLPTNQSVSGTVSLGLGTTTIGSVVLSGGVNAIGSVATLQGTNPWITANPAGSITAVAIVSGSVAVATGNSSVTLLTGTNTIGSVTALQGTMPWTIGSVYGNISGSVIASLGQDATPATASILVGVTANTNGSVLNTTGWQGATVQVTSGPGASITGQLNFEGSLDGTQFVPIQGYNLSTNAIASATGVESNWFFNTTGLQGIRTRVSNWTVGSITARAVLSPMDARPFAMIAVPTGNQSVSGTVNLGIGTAQIGSVVLSAGNNVIGSVATLQGTNPWIIVGSVYGSGSTVSFQGGTQVTSLVSTVPSSVIVGSSIFGQLPAGTAVIGSVAVLQGTNPWLISSVYGNISGSVVAFQSGTWMLSVIGSNPSSLLVGNYAQRNDAVASFLGGNLTWNPFATDSAGRTLVKPFASEDATIISYTGSIVSGSVQLIQASALGKRNYITDFWLSNTGATTTLVTIQGGDTSVLGQFIAPTGGGMSSPGIAIPLKTTSAQDLAFKVSPSTSVLYLSLKGYQAP